MTVKGDEVEGHVGGEDVNSDLKRNHMERVMVVAKDDLELKKYRRKIKLETGINCERAYSIDLPSHGGPNLKEKKFGHLMKMYTLQSIKQAIKIKRRLEEDAKRELK